MHLLIRERDFAITHILRGIKFDLLKPHHLGRNGYLAMFYPGSAFPLFLEALQDRNVGVAYGIGIIVGLAPFNICLAVFIVQLLNLVGFRLGNINSPFVQASMGTGEIDLSNDFALGAPGDIDDHEVLLRDTPQINLVGRIGILHPMPAIPRMMNNPFFLEIFQYLMETLPPEALPILEGEFKCRTLYVA